MNTPAPAFPRRPSALPRLSMLCAALLAGGPAAAAGSDGLRIQVNGAREFVIGPGTQVYLDDEAVATPLATALGPGLTVSALVGPDADPLLTGGTLAQVHFENALKGPITDLDPLAVLGNPVTINGDTLLVGFASPDELALGQQLEVAGFLDTNSSAVAARVKLLASTPNLWKLTGFVSAVDLAASTLTVGSQPVDFAGTAPQGCTALPLAIGRYVELRALPVADFVPGQVLAGVTRLRCLSAAPIGTPGAAGAIEGLVTTVLGDTSFELGGLLIQHGPQTQFRNGNADDIEAGVRLEAEGTFATATTFNARRIHFFRPQVRIEAPVGPADIVLGESVTALGETVYFTAQMRDEDGIYQIGLPAARQVELRAYLDGQGRLQASRARIRRNEPRPNELELQGPVHDIAPPAFGLLGATVQAGPTTVFLDRAGAPMTATGFFAALADGVQVEAEDGSYDPATRIFTPGSLQLDADDGQNAATGTPYTPLRGVSQGVVKGTVTGLRGDGDTLHANGFE